MARDNRLGNRARQIGARFRASRQIRCSRPTRNNQCLKRAYLSMSWRRSDNALRPIRRHLQHESQNEIRGTVRRGRHRRDMGRCQGFNVSWQPNSCLGCIGVLDIGDRVPADLRLTEANEMSVDESSFTGETKPSVKTIEPIVAGPKQTSISDRKNIIFMGTHVLGGNARVN